jgi:acyl CoA:acetate/3-ketoacid CoA transferase
MKDTLRITTGGYAFIGKLELKAAPKTCAAFVKALPFKSELIHVRWSGEGVWMPLGDMDFGVGYENNTCYPSPGQFILYPGGVSETEILLAYGNVNFASKAGQLSGNHFLTIVEGNENIYQLGRDILYKGVHKVTIDWA